MMKYGYEDSTSSKAAAEWADLKEALLRGELSRDEYTYLLTLIELSYDKQ